MKTDTIQVKTETQVLRDKIVALFLQAGGAPVSGTTLSEATGVTRTAIWKHIHQLEELGFEFASTPKVGHRLVHIPDVLMEPILAQRMPKGSALGHTVVFTPELDSTNKLASALSGAGATDGTVVAAQVQTSGRGRRGRTWFSHPGGAWFSVIVKRPLPLTRAFELTLLASVALRRVIHQLSSLDVKIKWPNDLFVDGRKLCGILAEIRSDGEQVQQAIVGVGVNCNIHKAEFPPAVAEVATSILAASGRPVDRVQLVARFLEEYGPMVDGLAQGQPAFALVHDEWCAHSHTLGKVIRVQTNREVVEGRASRLLEDGTLILETSLGQEISVHSGEVLF
jgi:BirA family transcriptional regulator, biotin operon repressor / biotin---[acetyl-CoA-carboxylase] ligase